MHNPNLSSSDHAGPPWLTVPEDLGFLDPVLWPQGTVRDLSGQILIGGQTVNALLEQYGSALYVMDEEDFRTRAHQFTTDFPGWTVHYAGKSFLCRSVARWIMEEGLGLDVCSGNELAVALSVGFPPERIGVHGNNKSIEELISAIEAGVGSIIVDSFDEIAKIETLAAQRECIVRVLVRVTTGVEAHTHEYIATSLEDGKFGFSVTTGQALEALMVCENSPHIHLGGIHSHIGSQIFDTEGFRVAARRTMALAAQFNSASHMIEEINLGGGFGIAYTIQDTPMSPAELNRGLVQAIDEARSQYNLAPVKLSIEPGRAICGPACVALYTVGTIKKVDIGDGKTRTYVAVDGGMSDNIRTALYQAEYSAVLANRSSDAEPMLSRVVGKHCESGDILVHDVYLPSDLRIGDIIAVPASGAYTRSMASNYNYALRPAMVAVNSKGSRLILRRETLEDLLALDVGEDDKTLG